MLASLVETLFQVGALPNTPLQTLNGIHAVAFLLQELELMTIAKEISTIVSKELTPLVDGLQTNFREKSEEVMAELHEKVIKMITQTKDSIEEIGKAMDKMISTAEKEKTTATPY
jgi:hypothetical protein